MKKYIFDLLYIGSIIIALMLIFSSVTFSQSNVQSKPDKVIKLTWDSANDPGVGLYGVFWCQGVDTSLFPFNTGTNPDSLWNGETIDGWMFEQISDLMFGFFPREFNGTSYVRLGVAAINTAGEIGLIQCIPKVIKIGKPGNITGVKAE